MENAVDALKIAFAVLVFTMALTLAITMFSQVNIVSKIVLTSSDSTKYYEYQIHEDTIRTVGLETIIPTLYKYYKENYTVLFLDKNGKPLKLYKTEKSDTSIWGNGSDSVVGTIGKYYTDNENKYEDYDKDGFVCTFDVEEETTRHEPWTGSTLDFKRNLDAFLNGGTLTFPSGVGEYDYEEGFIEKYRTKKFEEMLGEYSYNVKEDDSSNQASSSPDKGLLKNRKKRVIIYKLIN